MGEYGKRSYFDAAESPSFMRLSNYDQQVPFAQGKINGFKGSDNMWLLDNKMVNGIQMLFVT